MPTIKSILSQRTDLSTFLVHLTRASATASAKDNLRSIIGLETEGWSVLIAESPFGFAKDVLERGSEAEQSQRCVCFTETPLECIKFLVGPIDGRSISLEPYGIAMTKKQGRKLGANPVWYVDQTPGPRDWVLANAVNALIDEACNNYEFLGHPISDIAPFIDSMGTWQQTRKEFWWEREWRHVGDLELSMPYILLCPEEDFPEFEGELSGWNRKPRMIDPRWGLERMIAHLAGFSASDVEIV